MAAYPKGKNDVETMDTITNTSELINETIEKMRRIFFIYNLQLIFNNLTQFLWLKTALHSGSPEPASKRHQQHTKTIH